MKHIIKTFHFKAATPLAGDDENFIIRGKFSTADVDRYGEIVDQSGWKLDEFKLNPVILFAHDHMTPAIGKAIEIAVDSDGDLAGAIQFAVKEDTSGLSETIYNLFKGGYMRAFSVGFMNDVMEYDQASDQVTLKINTLLEISACNVPANAFALAEQKGLNMKALEQGLRGYFRKKEMKEIDCSECHKISVPDYSKWGAGETPNLCDECLAKFWGSVDQTKEAIKKISTANVETIKSAIETLTGVLKAETGSVKGRDGIKKIPVSLLNKAMRQIVDIKKIIKS